MKNFLTLTRMRMRLALRNRLFIFFSLIMPLGFFFLYMGFFAKGEPRKATYLLGPVIALTVMGSFWGLSTALVTFREQGILRRFRVAPVTSSEMLASSISANYLLTLPTVMVELLLARWIYHVHDMGNLIPLAILVTVGTVSFAALGLVIASVANTMQETQIICQIIWFALIFLSGATLPLPFLPHIVQRVAVFLPATYLVLGLQKTLLDNAAVWNLLQEKELSRLAALQQRLLKTAASLTRPGGALVYSTCSLEPEENERVVESFCRPHPQFALETTRSLFPPHDGVDGAFIARFAKH